MVLKDWLVILLLTAVLPGYAAQGTAKVSLVTPLELKSRLGEPGLRIIDVRAAASWAQSNRKIKGAVREDPDQAAIWGPRLPKGKEFVLY
jgi:hypothetical protein